MNKKFLEFSVNVYGEIEKYNEVLSKARCRIFYKYGNRNGTYITDEFAEELLSTLPYAPVKGIYEYDDFTDHGTRRSEGRIYGIVPENPNIKWETQLDEDGVERTYACADVLLFTGLYKEATEIVGKSQSMEIFEPSIQYHQAIIEGKRWIVFDKGCFLGLQALGDDVEPCFEGASFYTLRDSIEDVVKKLEEISATYSNKQKEGGNTEMNKLNFKLSDDQKYQALWSLLNSEYNEEGGWMISYTITSIYDEYALAYNYAENQTERVYYSKDDETDSLAITKTEVVYIMDVTQDEKSTLDTLRKLNGDTYELVSDTLANAEETAQKNSEFSTKIEELEGEVSTLNTEKVNSDNLYQEAQDKISTMETELNSLKEFKKEIDTKDKEAVLDEYEAQLAEEVIETYRAKLDEYSALELDKELAYELKTSNPNIFSKSSQKGFIPKVDSKSGIEGILSQYQK